MVQEFLPMLLKEKKILEQYVLNGPSARFFEVGDEIIILGLSIVNEDELKNFKMKIINLGEKNKIQK
jgi:aspartate 1-decarboxylase